MTTVIGPLPAGQAIAVITFSTLIHSWDVAHGIGHEVEFTPAEAELAEAVGGIVVPMLRPGGLFADEVSVAAEATPTQRVVAYTGRSPL